MMVYLPWEQSKRVNELAERLERPRSWVIQKALDISYKELQKFRPQIPKKLKIMLLSELKNVDKQTRDVSVEEIEKFSVDVVRDYRKKRGKKLNH